MTWRRVDPFFARRIQLATFLVAIGFGLDYLFTPVGSSAVLTFIERTWIPLWGWGVLIMLCGIAGLLVEWKVLGPDHPFVPTERRWKWGWISNTAHIILFGLFVVLSGSTAVDIVIRGITDESVTEGQPAGWYGWRTTVMWGGYAYVNWQFIRRLGKP